jgi:hypothetical protein
MASTGYVAQVVMGSAKKNITAGSIYDFTVRAVLENPYYVCWVCVAHTYPTPAISSNSYLFP